MNLVNYTTRRNETLFLHLELYKNSDNQKIPKYQFM